jgi:hypothetical protein
MLITSLMDVRKMGLEGVDFHQLAQVRGHWWVLVNAVMNLQFL